MGKRQRLWTLRLLLLALGVPLVSADARWTMWGRLRGDAFYRGRPTSYWAQMLKRARGVSFEGDWQEGRPIVMAETDPAPLPLCCRRVLDGLSRRLGFHAADPVEELFDLREARALTPVLSELLADGDTNIVQTAADCLCRIGPAARLSAPALAAALAAHHEEGLRYTLADALWAVDRRSEPAVPALAALLKAEDSWYRVRAASALGWIGEDARDASPALLEALEDEDPRVREASAWALKMIDPSTRADTLKYWGP